MKKKPTEAELEILQILWQKGPSSVRQIHEILSVKKDVFYTTTLKTMQVMTEKGFLSRDTSSRSHIYTSIIKQSHLGKSMLNRLIDTVFDGSLSKMLVSALGANRPSEEELKQIKELIDKWESNDDN